LPNLYNRTPLAVEAVPMIDAAGRQLIVVICKATFEIGVGGQLQAQRPAKPITYIDTYSMAFGTPIVRWPSDLVDRKPMADLLVAAPSDEVYLEPLLEAEIEWQVGALRFKGKVDRRTWPFGALSRTEEPRRSWAGTYDEAWVQQRMPLLPTDFDSRFHQSAPASQWLRLNGDEACGVRGLYPQRVAFKLPGRSVLVSGNVRGEYFTQAAVLDTLILDGERPHLTLVWRHPIVTRQKTAEVSNVHVHLARLHNARELLGQP
jgi:hypothetical protein